MSNISLYGTVKSESGLRNLLESLSLTDNIRTLYTSFSNLGYYILSNPQNSGVIVKFKPLYDKILLVLSHGPLTKTKLTLNLISSLMLVESSGNRNKTEALRMHAQNMIRVSGCLSALCHLFTNSMLQHETWIALCQGLSDACYKSVPNQSYCTHLVPTCIQRCRRSNPVALLVLHALLAGHDTNIKVFYESDGMSIFSRANLPYTLYLRTLNAVIEGTKPSHHDYIRNSHSIFKCLRQWALADDPSSSAVTKWAVIILYSRRKLLGPDSKLNDTPEDCINENGELKNDSDFDAEQDESTEKQGIECMEDPYSETHNLFTNIMKEVYDYQIQRQGQGIPLSVEPNRIGAKNNMTHSFKCKTRNISNSMLNLRRNRVFNKSSSKFQYGVRKVVEDLSFSFLLNESKGANRNKLRNSYAVKNNNKRLAQIDFGEKSVTSHNTYRRSKLTGGTINTQRQTELNTRRIEETPSKDTFGRTTCTLNENETAVINFRPRRVSTPKQSRYIRKGNTISNFTSTKVATFNRNSLKSVKNMSMTSKFMEIINGSCTTIARGISKIKNIFVRPSEVKDDGVNEGNSTCPIDCSYSFTNYMRRRDAIDRRTSSSSKEKSTISLDAPNSCRTCNNTTHMKRKLMENPSLKECIKKLKLGINLYGCDFKKISRSLWPREPYMTPEVLYTLYRKLIAK